MKNSLLIYLLLNISLLYIVAAILTEVRPLRIILKRRVRSVPNQLCLGLIFGLLSISGTYTGMNFQGAVVNTRVVSTVAAGLVGGPLSGLCAGALSGLHRYLFDPSGFTSLACGVGTFGFGIIGALCYRRFSRCSRRNLALVAITLVSELVQCVLILILAKPFEAAIALDEMLSGAWLGLADVYIKQGDWDAARATLEAGCAATGDADLGERLEQLDKEAPDGGNGNEVLSEDGNSSIRAEGNQLTLSLHVPDLQSSYAVNREDTPVNGCDCQWMVRFTDGTRQYEVGTSYWKDENAPEKTITLHEMQSNVWLFDSDRSSIVIAPAELEVAGTTLRWTFTIPEEYAFDAANMQITGTVIEAG